MTLYRPKCDNIKIDLEKTIWEHVNWIHLAQPVVNVKINLSKTDGNFSVIRATRAYSRTLPSLRVIFS